MDESKRPMPDWMMRYVSNIGTEECYRKFRELSKQYYLEIDDPDEGSADLKKPAQKLDLMKANRVFNNPTPRIPQPDDPDFVITETYKREARHLARNLGYGDIKLLEIWKENDPSVDDVRKNASREDKIANSAHREFAEKYPEKAAKSKDNAKQYLDREFKEYHNDKRQEHSSKKFEKSQDSFEEKRSDAAARGDKSFSKMTDDKEPDPDNSGGSRKPPKDENSSRQEKANNFMRNRIDITSNVMSKNYFASRGITQKMLDDLTSRENGFADKKESKDKDNTENQTKSETDRSPMVDAYFKKHGIVINKSEQGTPSIGRTISNDNFSITYAKQVSGGEPKKSRDMEKDKE